MQVGTRAALLHTEEPTMPATNPLVRYVALNMNRDDFYRDSEIRRADRDASRQRTRRVRKSETPDTVLPRQRTAEPSPSATPATSQA